MNLYTTAPDGNGFKVVDQDGAQKGDSQTTEARAKEACRVEQRLERGLVPVAFPTDEDGWTARGL